MLNLEVQILVQNLINLHVSSKSDTKWPKMAKSLIVWKSTYMLHSDPKAEEIGQVSVVNPKR